MGQCFKWLNHRYDDLKKARWHQGSAYGYFLPFRPSTNHFDDEVHARPAANNANH